MDAAFGAAANPFHYLGALTIFFFWIVLVTGIYLYVFYHTSVHGAYASVEYLTRQQWYLGGVLRSLHRYAADAAVITLTLHLIRHFAYDHFRGAHRFSWLTGVPTLWLVAILGITGYWLVWDRLAQYLAVLTTELLDRLPVFAAPIARNFLTPDSLSDRFFTLLAFLHFLSLPLLLAGFIWLHLQRISRPVINPPRPLAVGTLLALLALALLHPAHSQGPANLASAPTTLHLDWFYLSIYPLAGHTPPAFVWTLLFASTLLLCLLPWLPRRKAGTGTEAPSPLPGVAAPAGALRMTVLFGSETGHAAGVARDLTARARTLGIDADLQDMRTYPPVRLPREPVLLIIISTHGDGEPPDSARDLHALLTGPRPPDLHGVCYAVLALGDASHPKFCQAGKDFDAALAAAGAARIHPRVDCDLDYEQTAAHWVESVLAAVATGSAPSPPRTPVPAGGGTRAPARPAAPAATLIGRSELTGPGSTREVWHLRLDVTGTDIKYAPGDTVSVIPTNPAPLVEELLAQTRLDAAARVRTRYGEMPLAQALARRYEITRPTRPFLERYAELTHSPALRKVLDRDGAAAFEAWAHCRQIADIVRDHPADALRAQDFVDTLRPLPARRYSIASSLLACPGELHLTVVPVRYRCHGRDRVGIASTFLVDRLPLGEAVPLAVESNPDFHLPQDPDQAIIMVTAGCGVAPFRAFLQEREALGAAGRNWLFFGDRHRSTDFLYGEDWERWLKQGRLTRLVTAFSRDQAHKVYIQHRLREYGSEVYAWLEEGAVLYVCGAEAMGRAVDRVVVELIAAARSCTIAQAEDYVSELIHAGRYRRNVY